MDLQSTVQSAMTEAATVGLHLHEVPRKPETTGPRPVASTSRGWKETVNMDHITQINLGDFTECKLYFHKAAFKTWNPQSSGRTTFTRARSWHGPSVRWRGAPAGPQIAQLQAGLGRVPPGTCVCDGGSGGAAERPLWKHPGPCTVALTVGLPQPPSGTDTSHSLGDRVEPPGPGHSVLTSETRAPQAQAGSARQWEVQPVLIRGQWDGEGASQGLGLGLG